MNTRVGPPNVAEDGVLPPPPGQLAHHSPHGPVADDPFVAALADEFAVLGRFVALRAPELDRDDVVQDTVTRAWKKRGSFDPARASLRAWLVSIAADQIRQQRRGRARLKVRMRVAEGFRVTEPSDSSNGGPQDDYLLETIQRLPARQQETVLLHYFVGFSTTEIAEFQKVSVGTVKSSLSDGRSTLRNILERKSRDH